MHEDGFQVHRSPIGELEFRSPLGRLITEVPPQPAVPTVPSATLQAQNQEHGIHIDARTSTPSWLGERLDVGYAIDVLHPLATRELPR